MPAPKPTVCCYQIFQTPMGVCGVLQAGKLLVRSSLPLRTKAQVKNALCLPAGASRCDTPLIEKATSYLISFFGDDPVQDPPLWLKVQGRGDFFDQAYNRLIRVKAGKVISYGELATRAGSPLAVRAAGQAMARNTLAPLVPCHRVVRSDGSLGGYSGEGGLSFKRLLLEREGVSFDSAGRVCF